eukprot:gene22236-biopygen4209
MEVPRLAIDDRLHHSLQSYASPPAKTSRLPQNEERGGGHVVKLCIPLRRDTRFLRLLLLLALERLLQRALLLGRNQSGRTIEFKETGADQMRAQPFLPVPSPPLFAPADSPAAPQSRSGRRGWRTGMPLQPAVRPAGPRVAGTCNFEMVRISPIVGRLKTAGLNKEGLVRYVMATDQSRIVIKSKDTATVTVRIVRRAVQRPTREERNTPALNLSIAPLRRLQSVHRYSQQHTPFRVETAAWQRGRFHESAKYGPHILSPTLPAGGSPKV